MRGVGVATEVLWRRNDRGACHRHARLGKGPPFSSSTECSFPGAGSIVRAGVGAVQMWTHMPQPVQASSRTSGWSPFQARASSPMGHSLCLSKDPGERFHCTADARLHFQDAAVAAGALFASIVLKVNSVCVPNTPIPGHQNTRPPGLSTYCVSSPSSPSKR